MRIAALLVTAVFVAAFACTMGPDLARYIKIRSM
jgi:hypothetical protein